MTQRVSLQALMMEIINVRPGINSAIYAPFAVVFIIPINLYLIYMTQLYARSQQWDHTVFSTRE
jgi:hypothetical protein